MVRETRHLWVGNLPDNIREDRIREHFKRYGRVQNVKLLGRTENTNACASAVTSASAVGLCATVAFMDIKSASKAHNAEHVLDERTLTTEYYEPAAIPSSTTGAPSAGSSPAGSGYSGSSSSVNSTPAPVTSTRHPASSGEDATSTASVAAAAAAAAAAAVVATAAAPANWRGTNDSATDYCRRSSNASNYTRVRSSASYSSTPPPPSVEKTSNQRWYSGSGSVAGGGGGGESTPSTPGGATDGGGGGAGARRRGRSGSGGGSSRSDTSSPEPSDTSRASSPHANHRHNHRTHSNQWTSSASGRPLAICVRNLPTRSTDSSLKDGLYHEYKKHGKVVWVKVVGQNADRYAIVRFVKPSDVEKALEVSQDKLFFGCKISVAPHQSCDEDAESVKPYETDIDEYHPKATRTLFIGNLEKDVTQQQLRDKFKHFGRIIEIDIKKGSSGGAGYAFCQYASISSVVEAIRAMDGEYVGSSRVKLGFGKPVATTCVWVDGLTEHTEKQVLGAVSRCGAALSVCVDRAAGAALVHFEQAAAASSAVRELRRVAAHATHANHSDRDPPLDTPRLCVDYASRECQEAFYEQLEKHGGSAALAGSERLSSETRYIPASRHDQIRLESVGCGGSGGGGGSGSGSGSRARSDSYSRGSSRTPRLEPSEPGASPPGASLPVPATSHERRYRYDDLGSTPPPDELYEERLQSVVISPHRSRRHRRDSSPEEHKIKEWHRSVVGTSGGVVCTVTGTRRLSGDSRHRSRSGSRRRHRRRRDDSVSRGGTPLRDEHDGAASTAPCEPRRPPLPRDRSVPMMLPLPKFALQLRAQQLGSSSSAVPHPPAPTSPVRPPPPPPPPPAPPESDSSSAGSAPHSPSASLEERIRSLDEKYERWSRLDPPTAPPMLAAAAATAAPVRARGRTRHHLLDVDINEVKPSDVVRSLLAKRSVFDSDSERLEGTVRPSTPPSASSVSSASSTSSTSRPRSLIHPFPTHDRIHLETPSLTIFDSSNKDWANLNVKNEPIDRQCDSKPKVEKSFLTERLFQNSDSENASEPKLRLRTPSLDKAPENLSPKNSNTQDCDKVEKDSNRDAENVKDIVFLTNSITTKTEIEDAKVKESSTEIKIIKKDNTDSVLCMETIPLNEIPLPSSEKIPEHLASSKKTMETIQFKIKEEKFDDVISLPENHLTKLTKVEIEINDEISKMIQQQSSDDSVHSLLSSDINECGIKTADIPLPATDPPVNKKDLVIKKEPISKELEDIPIPIKRVNDIKNEIAEAKHDCITVVKNNNAKTQDLPAVSPKVQVKENLSNLPFSFEKQSSHAKINDSKLEKDKSKCNKDKTERDRNEIDREKHKSVDKKHEKDKSEKDKRSILEDLEKRSSTEKPKSEKDKPDHDLEKHSKDKHDRDHDKSKHEEKSRHEHGKKDKRKESVDCVDSKPKKDEKSRHDKHRKEHGKDHSKEHIKEHVKEHVKDHSKEHVKDHSKDHVKDHDKEHVKDHNKDHVKDHSKEHVKDHSKEHLKDHSKEHVKDHSKENVKDHSKEHVKESDSKRETRKENDSKSRKSSRDESGRDICRKDSTDSSTSRASHDSHKTRELDTNDNKDDNHHKPKVSIELSSKVKVEKDLFFDVKQETPKVKSENEKKLFLNDLKIKQEQDPSARLKSKSEAIDKRHHSLDSPSMDNKRKERLASCSSLPPNVGLKRRLSAQESYDSIQDDNKRLKHESKHPERRSSKDSRCNEKPKTTKFNKCHFAKLIESKTKDERKNQVKIDSHFFQIKSETKVHPTSETTKPDKKSPKRETDEKLKEDVKPEALRNDFNFLALLELRSSEEDEKQRALRNEMKEKKRIQQLQQIHELQMQQDAFQQQQHLDLLKKNKGDDKRKEAAREKRFSTDRKSRDEKCDQPKRKSSHRKLTNSSDTSDSDEPKKHSIFDIVDDGPTYISMYDKVKARSCKNMQKQEEEKRQEKIKARFSQLKQSRAKREEKKRSSWDEDSDSEHDRKHSLKTSITSSSEDEHKKREKIRFDSDRSLTNDYFMTSSLEDEHRNKQSRKNSRSRIMSDTSDDDNLKRNVERISNICDQVKKELAESESYSLEISRSNLDKCFDMPAKEVSADRIKKNSLLNLFGKTDIEENKVKLLSGDVDEYKTKNPKKITELSSESESMLSNSYSEEKRKKHKKKARNPKSSPSSEEPKENVNAALQLLTGIKHNNVEKSSKNCIKTHMSKILENERHNDFDTLKKAKCFTNDENNAEITAHSIRKDGKMEDIFGPLSDDSDYTMFNHYDDKPSVFNSNYDKRHASDDNEINHYSKERENIKRRKERRRKEKEKRHTIRDDDNSLDVDAVGRAIEARLFADVDNDSRIMDSDREELKQDHVKKYIEEPRQDHFKKYNEDLKIIENHGNDKVKRDAKEKKKKKKRSRDDRQNRREHHHHGLKLNHISQDHRHKVNETKDKLLENINFFQSKQQNDYDKVRDKHIPESASLPFITDSPQVSLLSEEIKEPKSPETIAKLTIDESMDVPSEMKETETKEIVLSSPTSSDDQEIIPPNPNTTRGGSPNKESLTTINTVDNANESAVRSISNIESDLSKSLSLSETSTLSIKSDEKEKPRAVISQEETEDAVAALLGESFGDNNKFNACYDEEKDTEIECPQLSPLANENIPEVDAEEMRQAVQNLNASEMEIKPETPVSDSDLLLIDTDTEETEEQPSEPADKLTVTSGAIPGVVIPKITPAKNSAYVQEVPNKLEIDHIKSVTEPKQIKSEIDVKASLQQPISSATAVITSWTLTNKNLQETQLVSLSKSNLPPKDGMSHESRPIATNIIHLKSGTVPSLAHNVNAIRPILGTPIRTGAPYQVIGQMVHAQLPKLQPPTIKIPEPHIVYQKPQGIVISPRMSNDPRLNSPKSNTQGAEGLHSPRLANMTILSTSPQNFNPVGLTSPKNLQQRSPGQVTVVRMQQPPLSPIQAMSLGNNRAMISPNRPNSVLVQTQGPPIHFNRLATPVLAPISKQASKGIPVSLSVSHQIPLQLDSGKDPRSNMDGNHENSKIIFSTSNLQPSTNPTIMAQNRLISMQNLHVGHMNSALHMSNKVILNKVPSMPEKPDHKNACFTPDNKRTEHNSFSYAGSPLIHVTGINQSAHIIQNAQKLTISDGNISRDQMPPNVIHPMNSPRLLTTATISNIIQLDANKGQPSVLTMAAIRHPSVLTKINSSNASVVTTSSLTNVLMTPLLLKTGTPFNSINVKLPESDNIEHRGLHVLTANSLRDATPENFDAPIKRSPIPTEPGDRRKELYISAPLSSTNQNVNKCDTDFEELLKDKTSEIKVINDLQKKLEINVGKSTAVATKPADEEIKSNITIVANERPVNQEVNEPANLKELECKSNEKNVIVKNDDHLNTNRKINIHEFSDFSHHNKDDSIAKNIDDNDPWSAKDVNIDSVIKKVDSLCNENIEDAKEQTNDSPSTSEEKQIEVNDKSDPGPSPSPSSDKQSETVLEDMDIALDENFDKNGCAKRGGRTVRGKKTNKQDRVQTRQIAKPARGGSAAKRGRGRGNSEKRIKSASNVNPSNLPGDVYDFHEDSGDETSSQNNNESRPRLILTIKSPLAGQPNATSTLTATTKDPLPKLPDKALGASKDERGEDFASPSLNTRKSRRLQQKDVHKPEEGTDEKAPSRGPKDTKKRPTRQAGSKVNYSEKTPPKVQRGVKRTRDRSTSDASMDSSDERALTKKDDGPVAAKVPKVAETLQMAAVAATITAVATKPEPQQQLASQQPQSPAQQSHLLPQQPHLPPQPLLQSQSHLPSQSSSLPQPLQNQLQPHSQSTQQYSQSQPPSHRPQPQLLTPQRPPQPQPPVLKPTIATIASTPSTTNTPITKPPKKMISEISAKLASAFEAAASSRGPEPTFESIVYGRVCAEEGLPAAATGEARSSMPQGALEAAAARVQSPALPHRAPHAHAHAPAPHAHAHAPRPVSRATPSLPRGAHHPPPPPTARPDPAHPAHPAHQRLPLHHASTARMTVTNVPHVSPGQIGVGDGIYPHFSHQHYQVYQQHFRATQHDARASPLPYIRTLEAEGSEAPAPPLELRRGGSGRVILYGCVGGGSPPPAHHAHHAPLPAGPPHAGPPHASQVPREADSLQMLLRRYPVMWQGLLALKNDCAAVQMHFVGGNPGVAGGTLPRHTDGSTPPLRIAQRMRLEPAQLDQVHRKMKLEKEHCILLALPCGRDHMDVLQQSTNLTAGFITYLQRKQAAGIVNVAPPGHQQAMYTVHIFPSCDFANENLNRIAPDLMHRVADIAHLLIVIATV